MVTVGLEGQTFQLRPGGRERGGPTRSRGKSQVENDICRSSGSAKSQQAHMLSILIYERGALVHVDDICLALALPSKQFKTSCLPPVSLNVLILPIFKRANERPEM